MPNNVIIKNLMLVYLIKFLNKILLYLSKYSFSYCSDKAMLDHKILLKYTRLIKINFNKLNLVD